MAITLSDILQLAAIYMGKTAVADLTINGYDAGTWAANAAMRTAERAHDFKFSEVNCSLSIGSTGASLSGAFTNTSLTVTGTLSPNIATAFALTGTFNGLPFSTATVGGVVYFISYNGSTAWTITAGGFTTGSNYWSLTTNSTNPAGSYAPHGANTGTATVAAASAPISVKRVQMVTLPISGGAYEPIELLTNDEYLGRVRRQIGRQAFDPTKGLVDLGVFFPNPFAYQNGNNLFLVGNIALPITAQLNIIQFQPPFVATTDSNFFTQYGAEYLQWASVVELNRWFRRYIPKQESNVDETAVQASADRALSAFIEWDRGIDTSTTTPPPPIVAPSQ